MGWRDGMNDVRRGEEKRERDGGTSTRTVNNSQRGVEDLEEGLQAWAEDDNSAQGIRSRVRNAHDHDCMIIVKVIR